MKRQNRKSLLVFFLFSHGWSWIFFFSILLLKETFESPFGKLLFGIAGIGPFLGAMAALYFSETKGVRRNYWRRFRDLSLISGKWLLIILFLPPLLKISGILAASLSVGTFPAEWQAYLVPEFREYLLPEFILFIFVFGPLIEEPAWRGWLQNFVQKRQSTLISGLIIGMIWGIWHLPMFLIPGTYQYAEGFLTADFWIWMADILGSAVLYAWIFIHTGGSIPAAILFHFSINYFGVLVDYSAAAEIWAILLKYILIFILLLKLGPRLSASSVKPLVI